MIRVSLSDLTLYDRIQVHPPLRKCRSLHFCLLDLGRSHCLPPPLVWSLLLVWLFPWRREWLPTPVFLPGESHGQRSLAGYSPPGRKPSDMTERLTLFTFPLALSYPQTCLSVFPLKNKASLDSSLSVPPSFSPSFHRWLLCRATCASYFHFCFTNHVFLSLLE